MLLLNTLFGNAISSNQMKLKNLRPVLLLIGLLIILPGIAPGQTIFTVADNFDPNTGVSGNDGTRNWTGNWAVTDADVSISQSNNPFGGYSIYFASGTDANDAINRGIDMSGANFATLTFDWYFNEGGGTNSISWRVDARPDASTNFTTLWSSGDLSVDQSVTGQTISIPASLMTNTASLRFFIVSESGNNHELSIDNIVVTGSNTPIYCTPVTNTNSLRYISNVSFNTINNTSAFPGSYTDYSSTISTNATIGNQYALNVRVSFTGTTSFAYVHAWIDWDQNGNLEDTGEYYYLGNAGGSGNTNDVTRNLNINVPSGAVLGTTRMRVASVYNNPAIGGSCLTDENYGEVEDYTVNVTAACTPPTITTQPSATSICEGDEAVLTVATSASSPIYQWQSSSDGSTWSYVSSPFNTNPVFFESDFSSTPANTNVYGAASVTGGYLQLTPATNSLTGGYVIQSTPGANFNAFNVNFDYRIYDGTGADGFSLSYGPNILSNAGPGEEGESSGLILKFDTYDNVTGTGTGSQIRISYNNATIWQNALRAFELRNFNYREVNLYVDPTGNLSLSIGGTQIISNLSIAGYTSADKSGWKFKFSGRTGGLNDTHRIDNLKIQFGDNPTLSVSPSSNTYYRVVVTSGECFVNSNSALVSVNPFPVITNPGSQTACDSYTLPTIIGTNLSGNQEYYNNSQALSGTVITSPITSTQTVWIYDTNGTCSDEESFVVTINNTPVITNPGSQTACDSYTLPTISGTNLSGNEAYYNNSQALGGTVIAGPITSTQTVWIYDENGTCSDEESFVVTINTTPVADAPSNVVACDSYTLPALTTGNYFTGSGGTGTALSAGYAITSTQTIYVYAETGTTPNCIDENSFVVTINPIPIITLSSTQAEVCFGDVVTTLGYSATTGSPNLYSINFEQDAIDEGFVNVTNATLTGGTIEIVVPETGAPATYQAGITVTNSTTGCTSISYTITIIIHPLPDTSEIQTN